MDPDDQTNSSQNPPSVNGDGQGVGQTPPASEPIQSPPPVIEPEPEPEPEPQGPVVGGDTDQALPPPPPTEEGGNSTSDSPDTTSS